MTPSEFQDRLLAWFDKHGRHDLPWQNPASPYKVWVSEVMLQQTQVATVIPYFNAFIARFPDIQSLAEASVDTVLQYWAGLGYYARGRNLHKCAQIIAERDSFPDSLDELLDLPGIGRSTAGAILSIAFKKSHPILDGNVKRVLTRYAGISEWPGSTEASKTLWKLSASYTPVHRVEDYTQAMMDLGATICTRGKPNCAVCPLVSACRAHIENKTATIPAPKPARKQPVKQVYFLCLTTNENSILLEQRPGTGIWGGLWSLPEFDTIESARSWCMARHIDIINEYTQPKVRHTFSHYHLDFTPLHFHTNNPNHFVMEANRMLWYKPEQFSSLALAAPIKRLLQQIYKD
ncbi:A/G-specific adenine glycosylase [Methylotuvimicrobium alcaliphilum]|uniref:Adenine DNA glycosylase n=1 Tax=Methylotuvimicrobium alcaliphilum (strain DSM 19304 / NCIMB 14124 / VKM B-2133 / 20Z) TaxID=1091494 RepID=G4T0L6_META2|nr:A/G-specific adenine glycosylase [Methylotuvimicrobium alcaliphilum]CCE25620.1 A/G-specific adenine glycosylase [Methylotuvimicrobium alcaliphilum 20Z]